MLFQGIDSDSRGQSGSVQSSSAQNQNQSPLVENSEVINDVQVTETVKITEDQDVAKSGELIGVSEGSSLKESLTNQEKLAQMEAIINRNKQVVNGDFSQDTDLDLEDSVGSSFSSKKEILTEDETSLNQPVFNQEASFEDGQDVAVNELESMLLPVTDSIETKSSLEEKMTESDQLFNEESSDKKSDDDLGLDFSLVDEEVDNSLGDDKSFHLKETSDFKEIDNYKGEVGDLDGEVKFREFDLKSQKGQVLDLSDQLKAKSQGVNAMDATTEMIDEKNSSSLTEKNNFSVQTENVPIESKFSIKEGVSDQEEDEAMNRLKQNIEPVDLEGKSFNVDLELSDNGQLPASDETTTEALPEKRVEEVLSSEDEIQLQEILDKAKEKGPFFAMRLAEKLKSNFILDKVRDSLADNRESYKDRKDENKKNNEN